MRGSRQQLTDHQQGELDYHRAHAREHADRACFAFDLSPDSFAIALAQFEHLDIAFAEMAAETLDYEDDFFDAIVARDILHHVDVRSPCMRSGTSPSRVHYL